MAYVTIPKDLSPDTEQGLVRADQTTSDLFRSGGAGRRAAFLFGKGEPGNHRGSAVHHPGDVPFFLFAMYEKNGQPLEVFLGHLIQNKFIRPKVRIYQTNILIPHWCGNPNWNRR